MASSKPVMICVIRQMPSRDPKFHQAEMFDGVGRSTKESLMIFSRGWFLRRFRAIRLVLYVDRRMRRMDRANVPR